MANLVSAGPRRLTTPEGALIRALPRMLQPFTLPENSRSVSSHALGKKHLHPIPIASCFPRGPARGISLLSRYDCPHMWAVRLMSAATTTGNISRPTSPSRLIPCQNPPVVVSENPVDETLPPWTAPGTARRPTPWESGYTPPSCPRPTPWPG